MKITPNNFTIGQLYTNSMEQFFIPAYQRRYAWNLKQLDALFNDINQLDENDFHLLGTVLFLTEEHKAGLNILEVVDGQQRITTISILLKVFMDHFGESNGEETSEIKRYLSCKDIDRKQFNKLKLGDLDNSDYEKIINGDMEGIVNKNLLSAYTYFKEKIEGLGDKAFAFCDKLINKTLIIRLDISQAKDAYKLFETINNRGLKLTTTDIIKNFILGHASLIDEKTLNAVKNNWRSLIVNLDGLDSDGFFRHFMMGKVKIKVPKSKLSESFKHYYYINVKEANILSDYRAHFDLIERADGISEEGEEDNGNGANHSDAGQYSDKKVSILEFSKALRDATEIYSKLENRKFDNPKINAALFDLSRIEARPAFTFLLDLFQRKISEADAIEIIRLIETFMLRRHICEYRTSELDDIFSRLVKISDENIAQNVKDALKEELPSNVEFFEKFQKARFKGLEDRAKAILEKVEYYLIKDRGEYSLKSGNDVHLEHIIPLTINTKKSVKQFGDWPHYLGEGCFDKHKDYVWRIGNLTIISQTLNIIASNNPFRAKLKEYAKSNISLNKKIIKEFSKFKFSQVDERSKELAEVALKIWKF
ncbi:MAG: DUF262 domain-containing HNH endonuclease family protein [Candidatus Methylomirabilota bacterium]